MLTTATHLQTLVNDVRLADREGRRDGAILRLAFCYPQTAKWSPGAVG
jgi:hypothetical protein